jgi:hypothetical protein
MIERTFCAALLVLAALAGCSGSNAAPTYPVTGTVTLDGKPLEEGEIYFLMPAKGEVDIVAVKNGKFEGQVKAGNRRVEIRAYKIIPAHEAASMPGYTVPESRENYLPAKYNTESTLTAEVKADGENQFDFQLQSK